MVKTSEMSMELKQELAFTKEELAELEAAKKMPITFDADCPETTPERAVKFRRFNPPRNRMDAHGASFRLKKMNKVPSRLKSVQLDITSIWSYNTSKWT